MSFRVHGSVVEAETGRPLAGVLVRVYDPSGRQLLGSTEREVRFGAGCDEFFEVRIHRKHVRET